MSLSLTIAQSQNATIQTLDKGVGGGDVGEYASQEIVSGNPAMAYFDDTENALMFVRATDASGTAWGTPIILDSSDLTSYCSLEIIGGNPAVSYHAGGLKYVRANDAAGTSWGAPVLVSISSSYYYNVPLKSVNGRPAIAYYNSTNSDVMYVRANDATGAAWGTPVIVDAAGGYDLSLRVIAGNPAISYYANAGSDLGYVRATDADGAVWGTPVVVDSPGTVGQYTSLQEVGGSPAISYYDSTNSNLKFVKATDATGATWGTPLTLDSTGTVGQYTSLHLVSGNPAISYYDSTNSDLKYVRSSDASGTSWGTPVTAASTGSVGQYTSMRGANGNPAISYYDYTNGDLKYVRSTDATGSVWGSATTPDAGAGSGVVGLYTSQTMVNGRPAVSYYDSTNGDLKYVRATDARGTSWGTPIILDSVGDVGSHNSIQVVNGNPAISYYDSTNGDLKYIRAIDADGTAWSAPLILDNTVSNVGWRTSCQIVNGNPAVSYFSVTGTALKYVRATDASGGAWGAPVTVVSSGMNGEYNSLKVVNGNPAISYYDGNERCLKYVRATNSTGNAWGVPVTVDSSHATAISGSGSFFNNEIEDTGTFNSLNGVWGTDIYNVWAVGGGGTIVKRGFGSPIYSWSTQISGTTNDLNAIWGSDNNNIWAVGNTGTILKWNGGFWSAQTSGTTSHLRGVWGTSSTNIWAVGDSKVILRWNGTSWSQQAAPPVSGGVLRSVWGADTNNVWAVGDQGNVFFWNGTTWSDVTSGLSSTITFNGVWAANASNAWAVGTEFGSNPVIYYWNGSSWVSQGFFYGSSGFTSVWGRDSSNVFAVSTSGEVYSNTFGSWFPFASPIQPSPLSGGLSVLNAISGTSTYIWAVGSNPPLGEHNSLQVINGRPAISYDTWGFYDGAIRYVRASDADGSAWGIPVAIEDSNRAGLYSSLQIIGGRPAVSYENWGALKYAQANDANGTTWKTPRLVDSTAGAYTSLIEVSNGAAVSYYDSSKGNLKHVVLSDGSDISVEQPASTVITDGGSRGYGTVGVGNTSDLVFTIRNTGNLDLVLDGTPKVTVSGTDAALFTVTSQPTSPLAENGTTTFTVRYAPTSTGAKTAALSISSNDADENPYDITLTGTAELLPAVTTTAASSLTTNTASLNGTVNANGLSTTVTFEYGLTTAYGSTLNATPSPVTGSSVTPVSANLTALLPNATYHYRTKAVSAAGTSYGSNITFTTTGAQPGDLDALDANVSDASVFAIAVQPDGKTIIAGQFTSVLGVARINIARLNADGTLDTGFDPKANGNIYSVAVQADGKILLGGSFTTLQPNGAASATTRNFIARVNADGTLDTSFDPKANDWIFSLAVQADGKILLGGSFTTLQPNGAVSSTPRNHIARVNADGTLDTSFDPKPNNWIVSMALQADGKILLGGSFTSLQPNGALTSTTRNKIARVNADGTLDTGFDPNANSTPYCVAVQTDGKVLIGGTFTTLQPNGAVSATTRNYIARVNADGTLDMSFNPNAGNSVRSMALQADEKILLGGNFTTLQPNGAVSATARQYIARVNANGTLDMSFDPKANSEVYGVTLQADGKILVGGNFTTLQPNGAGAASPRNRFARLLNNGTSQTLSLPDATRVSWLRSGAGPEVSGVTFEQSINGGATWTLLGAGTRVIGGWELTGLSLQSGGTIRARGRTSGGYNNGSSGLIEQVVSNTLTSEIAVEQPALTNMADGSSRDLGALNVGSTGDVVFTIKNSGSANLNLTGTPKVVVTGTDASLFTVTSQPTSPVAPGGSTTFTLRFAPTSPGAKTAALSIANDDTDENPFDIQLTATGLGAGPLSGTDNFNDNSKDPTTWSGTDIANGGASLVEVNGRLEYRVTTPDVNYDEASRPWALNIARNTDAFDVILDVFNNVNPAGAANASIGITVTSLENTQDSIYMELGRSGPGGDGSGFLAGLSSNVYGGDEVPPFTTPTNHPAVTTGSVRLSYNPTTKVFTAYYDTTGSGDGFQWQSYGTFGVGDAPGNGATRNSPWQLSGNKGFIVSISGYSEALVVSSGSVYADNFTATTTGFAPEIVVEEPFNNSIATGATVNFGTTQIGVGIDRVFTVRNTGTASLTGLAASITSGSSFYSVTVPPATTVAPGGSTSLTVRVGGSTDSAPANGVLSLASTDSDENPFIVNLTGAVSTPPSVTTNAATSVTHVSATLNGFVSSSTTTSTVTFDYGLTTSYGSSISATPATVSSSSASVSAVLTGLQPSTTYHYRVRATSGNGNANGSNQTFTTRAIQAGDLDSLNVNVVGSYVTATGVQPDGKIIIGGNFTSVNGVSRSNIARLNADGSLDTSFDPKANGEVFSITLQPDGKILLGGQFTTLQPNGAASTTSRQRIARVNADGSLDISFDPKANAEIDAVVLQADGKILLGGGFTTLQPNGAASTTARQYIARVNADGSLDTGFDPKANNWVDCVSIQADNKILIGGLFTTLQPNGAASPTTRNRIARLNTNGSLDTGFDPQSNGQVNCLIEQPDGKILLAGAFTTLQPNGAASPTTRNRVARVNADGSLDTGFDPKADSDIKSMALQTDGKILLGGLFLTLQPNGAVSTTSRQRIARVHADGSLDVGFDPKANNIVWSVAVQANGKILLGGAFTTLQPNGAGGTTSRNSIAWLNNDAVIQTLSVPDATQVLWQRGGGSPEVSLVTFEQSLNGGVNWTALGNGTRVGTTANWQLTGLSLPSSGYLRVRGRTTNGIRNAGLGLIETATSFGILPSVTTAAASNVTSVTATLNGTVNPNLNATTVTFEYGPTTSYGSSISATLAPVNGSSALAVSAALSGLTPGATYHYRLVGVNSAGTSNGANMSFTAASTQPVTRNLVQLLPAPATGAQTGSQLGYSVAVEGIYTVVGVPFDDVGGTDSGVVKIFHTTTGALLHTITNPSPGVSDFFGWSVDISGSRIVVGAFQDDAGASNAGSVYVYDLSGATPTLPLVTLNNPNLATGEWFGYSVSIDGSKVAVGSSHDDTGATDAGSSYVYDLSSFTPTLPLLTLNNPSPAVNDSFGCSVAISGNRVVVGAYYDDTGATDAGSAYVYDLSSGTPTVPLVTLNDPGVTAGDSFGWSVAISGTRLVVGAWHDNTGASSAGRAYVYDIGSGTPAVPVLTLNNPTPAGSDYFGYWMAISGTRVVVGAHYDDAGATNAGCAHVYDLSSGTPTVPVVTLNNPSPVANDYFGNCVAVDGTHIVIGAYQDDTGTVNAGSAYIYDLSSGTPTVPTATLNSPGPSTDDRFGAATAISGTRTVVGMPREDTGASNAGSVFVNDSTSGTPAVPVFTLSNPGPAADDNFGNAVAIQGSRVLVGTPNDDTTAANSGAAYYYDLSSGTPTVPVYTFINPVPGANDNFGNSVALEGTLLVIGAAEDDTSGVDTGSAYVYDLASATPTVPAYIINNPSPASGDDSFGNAVGISGRRIVIAALSDDPSGIANAGSVYAYDLNTGTPTVPVAEIFNPLPASGDFFGWHTAISGSRIVVGALADDTLASDAGAAYVYDLNSGTPTVPVFTLPNPTPVAGDNMGHSVAIAGNWVTVGASNDGTAATGSGSVYYFDLAGASPTVPVQTLPNPSPSANDDYGLMMAMDGQRFVVGAPFDDMTAVDKGAAYVFDAASPEIAVEQPALTDIADGGSRDFGGVNVGSSATLTFTIKNTGGAYLNLTGAPIVAVGGVDAAQFLVTQQPISALAPGGSSTFTIRFAPTSTGAKTASLSIINTDDDESTFDIALAGTAVAPEIVVERPLGNGLASGATINLGTLVPETNTDVSFTVKNIGTAALSGVAASVSGTGYSLLAAPAASVPGPSGSTTLTVRFNPLAEGAGIVGTLAIASNDADENPFTIQFTANAVYPFLAQTNAATGITRTQATLGGQVFGVTSSTNVFFDYGKTTSYGTTVTATPSPIVTGSAVEAILIGLQPATTYHYRVRAVGAGTVMGADQTFTTAPNLPGDDDLTFNPIIVGGSITATVVQPDGKVIIAGSFIEVNGVARSHIARLNANGTLDMSFNPRANDMVLCVALQQDGKIVIGGSFTALRPNSASTPTTRNYIARLNANGTLDTTFNPNADSQVNCLAVQKDGKILIGGVFTSLQPNGAVSATPRNYVARLNVNGSLDTGFDPNPNFWLFSMAVQADDKILLGGIFSALQPNGAVAQTNRDYIARVNADGSLDTGFDPRANGAVNALLVQADGKVLLGGDFTALQPNGAPSATARGGIARVNADGTLDAGFDPRSDGAVLSFALQADGRILIGGTFLTLQPNGAVTPTLRGGMARLNSDGSLDTAFDPRPNDSVQSMALQADGKIVIGGAFTTLQPNGAASLSVYNRLARINNDSATQSFTVPDTTQLLWQRGGASADFSRVSFEQSLDAGVNWTALGNGSRVGTTANWQITGITLPASAWLRASGHTPGGLGNGSSGLLQTVLIYPPLPEIEVVESGSTITDNGSRSFGALSVGDSHSLTFVIRNTGSSDLTGLGITIDGADASQFSITENPVAPVGGPAGETTFTMKFAPTNLGTKTAALHIASNDTDENPFDITLTGIAVGELTADNFSNRLILGNMPVVHLNGTNNNATLESGENTFGEVQGATVWAEWTAPVNGWMTINTVGSNLDTVIGLYTGGGSLAGLSLLGFNDESRRFSDLNAFGNHFGISRLVFLAQAGTTYQISVGGWKHGADVEQGSFQLHIETEPTPAVRLMDLSLDPNAVNVTSAAQPTMMNIFVESDADFLSAGYMNARLYRPGSSDYTSNLFVNFTSTDLTSGTVLSGVYAKSLDVPRYLSSGAMPIIVSVWDGISYNDWSMPGHDLFEDTYLIPALVNPALTVTNNGVVDDTAPTIVSVTGIPPVVDVTSGDVTFDVDITFTDGQAGLTDAFFSIFKGSFGNNYSSSYGSIFSGNANSGVYRLTVTVPQTTDSGIYYPEFSLKDKALNQKIYSDYAHSYSGYARISPPGTDLTFQVIGEEPEIEVEATAGGALTDDGPVVDLGTSGITETVASYDFSGSFGSTFSPFLYEGSGTAYQNAGALYFHTPKVPGGESTSIYTHQAFRPTSSQSWSVEAEVNLPLSIDATLPPGDRYIDNALYVAFAHPDGRLYHFQISLSIEENRIYQSHSSLRDAAGNEYEMSASEEIITTNESGVVRIKYDALTKRLTAETNTHTLLSVNLVDAGWDMTASDTFMVGVGFTAADCAIPVASPISVDDFRASISPTVTDQTFTITNTGPGSLDGLKLSKDGPHAADFTVGTLGSTSLQTGQSTTFSVSFVPSGAGARSATLHLASTDANENPFEINLSGDGSVTTPTALTLPPSNLTRSAATLNGLVNDNGASTTVSFDYGATTSYGLTVAATPATVSGTLDTAVSAQFTGLTPGATIHYRVRAVSAEGTTLGDDQTFTVPLFVPGAVDTTFQNPGLLGFVSALALQPDGKIVVGGSMSVIGSSSTIRLARLLPDGSREAAFTTASAPDDEVYRIAVQADGKIIISGRFLNVGGQARTRLARLNSDGSLDTAFNAGAVPNEAISALVPLPDGKLLVGGYFNSFNSVGGSGLVRLNANGSVDTSFTTSVGGDVYAVVRQPDGKILIGGDFTTVNGQARSRIARLNADGTVESTATFNVGTGASNFVQCMVVQADGKIIVAGGFTSINGLPRPKIARLNANGSVESSTTFNVGTGPNGLAISGIESLALQADGKILIGGDFNAVNGQARNCIARLNSDGSLEDLTLFDAGNGVQPPVNNVTSVLTQADGNILIGGSMQIVNGVPREGVARLVGTPGTQSLTVPSLSQMQWLRGGGAPEASAVLFDLSTNNGTTWTRLGEGTRMTGGWQISGLSLPAGGLVRAQARVASGSRNGSSSLLSAQIPFGTLDQPEISVFNGSSTSVADQRTDNVGTFDFGPLLVGTSTTRTFTLRNDAAGALTGIGISLGGTGEFNASAAGSSALVTGASTTFTVSFAPTTTGIQTRTILIASNDADEGIFEIQITGHGQVPPQITTQPVSRLIGLGFPSSLSVIATGTALQYQWFRQGLGVPGATAATFAIPSASVGLVGAWRVRVSNGVGSAFSDMIHLGVVDLSTRSISLTEGQTLILYLAGAAPDASYRWMRGGVAIPRGINPENQLTLTGIQRDQSGAYTCLVTMPDPRNPGTPLVLQSGAVTVNVGDSGASSALSKAVVIKPILRPFSPDPWIVGGEVREVISAMNAPSRYTVTGLPKGVKFNARTGEITGSPAVAIQVPTSYPLTITASNAAGSSTPLKTEVIVQPLPGYSVGNFSGLVERQGELNGTHGGRVTLTVSATGALTGKITLAATTHSFSGKLASTRIGEDVRAEVLITRATLQEPLRLILTVQRHTGELTGSLSQTTEISAQIHAWRQAEDAAALAGACTLTLAPHESLIGDTSFPQTKGTLTLRISKTGVPSWTGRLADGSTLTGSSALGRSHQIPLHHFHNASLSSLQGWLSLLPDSGTMSGALDWQRLTGSTAFPLLELSVSGNLLKNK